MNTQDILEAVSASFIPAFFLISTTPSPTRRFIDSLFDNTFAGIHHLDWFDWAMMVPYFAVLLVLSCYGLHRYEMIRGYWKHRKKFSEVPPQRYEQLPRVTIQLPIYNEQYVVERLIEAASKMEYPRDLFEIQVAMVIRPALCKTA